MWRSSYGDRKKASTHTQRFTRIRILVFEMLIFGVLGAGRQVAHPHTQNWNRGLTGLALGLCVCVWVWGGSHNHCTGEVACGVQLIPSLKPRIHTSISYLAVLKLFRMIIFGGHFEEFVEVGAAGCSQFVPL